MVDNPSNASVISLALIFVGYKYPIDPNPAVAARVVFPKSGGSRPEKLSKIEPLKSYLPHIGVQYIKLEPMKCPFKCKRNCFVFIKLIDNMGR